MSDDHLRDKIVQYFIVGLLAAVVIFLVFGLARGNGGGDDDSAEPPTPASPSVPAVPRATSAPPQVGCQQPNSAAPVKGKKTLPPTPGVSARKSGTTRGVVSVTIPTSTQECRVAKVRVQLDSTTDKIAATTKTVSVLTGPPVRKIKVKMRAGSASPQLARAFTVTPDGRSSSGATVAVR